MEGYEKSMGMYDEKLNSIIKKYGYETAEMVNSTQIHSAVIDIFTKRCVNKTIAIWGVGKKNTVNSHAAVIISKYILNLQGLKYLVDASADIQGTNFMGFPVIAPNQLGETDVDIVIVGSRASAVSIIESIKEAAPGCEYLDIYEELRNRGIVIDYNFFSEQNMYTNLYQLREEYEKAEVQEKPELLRKIIGAYFSIRDFAYADKYAGIYIGEQYEGYEKLVELLGEVKELQGEVLEINSKKRGSVLVHLIDSLRAVDVYGNKGEATEFKMFQRYQENALRFTNAYSTGPTTYESVMGVVKQKLSFDEDVYDNNFMFSFDEFPLLEMMKRAGKKILFYVAKDYYIMEDSEEIVRKEHLHMTEKLWNVACDMAESSREIFAFLYYPWELHFPLLCGYLRNTPQIKHFSDVGVDDMSDFIERQFEDCKEYVDLQFDYYRELLGVHTTNVFFGDHSQPVYNAEHKDYPYYMYYNDPDRVSHVAFFISGDGYGCMDYKKMVSMIDFNKIIEQVVCNKSMEIPDREVVRYQYYNIQNKKLREVAAKKGFWDYTEGIQCFLSEKYLYVITATGKEEIYIKSENGYRSTGCVEGKQFAEQMKRVYDVSFPDFWTVRYGQI
ncbi:MAG: hypothetical protein NC489_45565 [Ruminococcus flavefaciens]|nr:hypothetical protein [Ruminococcus flavefaciens]